MTFLLVYSPLCCLSCESHVVHWHPPPLAVNESPDYFNGTHVKSILGGVFSFFNLTATSAISIGFQRPVILHLVFFAICGNAIWRLWRLKVRYFFVREPLANIWNVANMLPSVKGSDSALFLWFFRFFFGEPAKFSGTLSLHGHFLKNRS